MGACSLELWLLCLNDKDMIWEKHCPRDNQQVKYLICNPSPVVCNVFWLELTLVTKDSGVVWKEQQYDNFQSCEVNGRYNYFPVFINALPFCFCFKCIFCWKMWTSYHIDMNHIACELNKSIHLILNILLFCWPACHVTIDPTQENREHAMG